MSLKSKFVLLMLLAAWITTAADPAPAEVVHENHLFPEFCPEDLNFNWFEPIYCDCGDERPLANLGFFFEYQRLSTNVSRPREAAGHQDFGDWSNGNIFDFGYMRESDHHGTASGWLVSVEKIDNPNQRLVNTNIDRNGVILLDLLGNPIGDEFVQQNAFNVYSIDINRVWRMEPTFHGAILEPFVGVRYNRIRDHFDRAAYTRFDPVFPTTNTPNSVLSATQFDTYLDSETFTDNDLYGGQVGLRAFKKRGRWRVETQIKGFAFHNFAERDSDVTNETTSRTQFALYDANGNLTAIANGPLGVSITREEATWLNNRFTWGGELRLDLGFDITKKFAIEVGAQFLAFRKGIGRGDTFPGLGENFTAGGATLGFSINR